MIIITPLNTSQYFEEEVVDAIFDLINESINEKPDTLTRNGKGCFCSHSIPTKVGLKNLYVEYEYEIIGSMNQHPLQFKILPNEVIIFDKFPNKEILEKIDKVKKALSYYSTLN
jgi:hypothetical protein